MTILLYAVHVLVCFFLIAVVLLQQGKGADLSVFGGGATQTAFGARGAATVLHKMTVISFVLFIVTTLGIGIVQARRGASDIFEDLEDEAAASTAAESATAGAADEPDAADGAAEEPQGAFAVEATDEEATDDGATEEGTATDGGEAGDAADGAATDAAESGDGEPADDAAPAPVEAGAESDGQDG